MNKENTRDMVREFVYLMSAEGDTLELNHLIAQRAALVDGQELFTPCGKMLIKVVPYSGVRVVKSRARKK